VLIPLLSILGCQPDPLAHPDFRPASEGDLRIELFSPEPARVGEPIELRAVISAPADRSIQHFDTMKNSLSGRGDLDIWRVRPEAGWADPSPWWQDSAPQSMLPTPTEVAPDQPLEWTVQLNDWVRFDRPGRYAVQLESLRGGKRVRSNAVAVEVNRRDPGAAGVADLVAAIDSTAGAAQAERIRELAWTGTVEARELALERLASGGREAVGWAVVLAMQPDAKATRKALDAALDAKDVGVSVGHVQALEALDYDAEYAHPNPPAPDGQRVGKLEEWRAGAAERVQTRLASRQRTFTRLLGGVDTKVPAARGSTLGTLVFMAMRESLEGAEGLWPRVQSDLGLLPGPVALDLLERHWDRVLGPEVVPALVTLAGRDGEVELRSAALRRLVQLDLSAAQPIVEALVADPKRPVRDVDVALRSLPSVSEPTQLAIVAGLSTAPDRDQQARLLGQYVSADSLDAVKTAWNAEPEELSTAVLSGYAAYFLQHDPPVGEAILGRLDREHYELLNQVGELLPDPSILVPRALEGLMSPERFVAFKSSDYLIEHAPPELLPRLIAMVPRAEGHQEEALVGVIAAARSWLITIEQRHLIGPQLSDKRADMVLRSSKASDSDFVVLKGKRVDGQPVMFLNYRDYVGAEQIAAKVGQFRQGQVLKFTWQGVPPSEGEALFAPILESAGVELFIPEQ